MKKTNSLCDCDVLHEKTVEKVKGQMPSDEDVSDISDFFRIFADSTRIKILWSLDKSELCVCDIAVLLDMTKSAVSHQLRVLKDASLVKSRREGKVVFYSLADEHIKDIFEKAVEHIYEKA